MVRTILTALLLGSIGFHVGAKPNVVLMVADDHGREAMGAYGNPIIKTSNMDQLAKEGTLYANAFCTTASCSASRSVILSGLHNHATGQYGHQHSFHHFAAYSSVKSLPVILTENGYRTARIGKFHVAPDEVFKFETVLPSAGGNRNSVRMADNCKDFVADKSKPFFLYFCVSDPHRGGGKLKDVAGGPDAFGNDKKYEGVDEVVYDPAKVIVPAWMPDTAEARAEIAQYYQAISRVDQGLGRLVKLLKDAGQWENTVFIYTADNGSAMPGSKTTLYDPGMRLPLIVRAPGAKAGVTSEAMVSWVDFAPTILDLAGVKEVLAPPLRQGEAEERGGEAGGRGKGKAAAAAGKLVPYAFHGRSFRPTLGTGGPAPEGWREVYASHTFHEITMYYPMRVIRTDRYKLIYNVAHQLPFPFATDLQDSATWQSVLKGGTGAKYGKRTIDAFVNRPKYELYDLQADPDEAVNLADKPEMRATLGELSGRLKAFQEKTKDPWVVKYEYE
ncbi:MAG TPA: sulfatase [Tepidisphaeraceae bacterium]|nr:sulfatase [Tepidisphaeraceae bacterium]